MANGFKRSTLCSLVIALSHSTPALSNQLFTFDTPYGLRVSGEGFLTQDENGDVMLDLFRPIGGGNRERLFYVDGRFLQGRKNTNTLSMGLGFRGEKASRFGRAILGGFVMGDHMRHGKSRNAWIINPGLEVLTTTQEAHLNVYAPISGNNKSFDNVFASEIPQEVVNDTGEPGTDVVRAQGNTFFDTPVALTQQLPVGAELEVGQRFRHNIKGRLGAYYFHYKRAKHLEGVEANVDIPLQTRGAHLLFMDSFDNQRHNLFSVGLRIQVGDIGKQNAPTQLSDIMTTPQRTNIAGLQTGSAVPTRLSFRATGPGVTRNNVFFFSRNGRDPGAGAVGDYQQGVCTAESPCRTFDQNAVDGIEGNINANGNFYFLSSGTFNPNQNAIPGLINFNNGADGSSEVWGFGSDRFNLQANGEDRPLINGALFWGDDNNGGVATVSNGIVKNLRVSADNTTQVTDDISGFLADATIGIGATGNITVRNSNVTATDIIAPQAGSTYLDAIGVFSDTGNATVTDSTITATASGDATGAVNNTLNDAYGVRANGAATVSNSTITATASGNAANNTLNDAYGVRVLNGAATVSNATITATASGDAGATTFNDAYGVRANGGAATVSNATITVTASGDAAAGNTNNDAYGVRAFNGNATVSNSIITAAASGDATAGNTYNHAFGVRALNRYATVRGNSTITATASGDAAAGNTNNDAYGVFGDNATVTGSTITATASGDAGNYTYNDAYGVRVGTGNATVSNATITATVGGDAGTDTFNNAFGVSVQTGDATVSNATITATASGDAGGVTLDNAYGVFARDGDATVSNATITATASGDAGAANTNQAFGVRAGGAGDTITINNSTIIVSSNNVFAVVFAYGAISGSGNICIENGTTVDCF